MWAGKYTNAFFRRKLRKTGSFINETTRANAVQTDICGFSPTHASQIAHEKSMCQYRISRIIYGSIFATFIPWHGEGKLFRCMIWLGFNVVQ